MKNLFITGGSGTVGKAFIQSNKQKYKIFSFSRNEKAQVSLKRNFPEIEILAGGIFAGIVSRVNHWASSISPPSGFNSPDFSAASIIARPTLSLIDPPGLWDSSLTKSSQGPVSKALSFSIGVLPISDSRDVFIVIFSLIKAKAQELNGREE